MAKTILANVKGWTPVINRIVDDVGLLSAVVFGRMWRFCQMEDGVCTASLETIGVGIGLDRSTVMRHAKKLCEAGYLKDLTPHYRNKPHVYTDTGKASLSVNITVAESNVKQETVAESNATVAESQLKKDSKKEIQQDEEGKTLEFKDAYEFYLNNFHGAAGTYDHQLIGDMCDEHTPHWTIEAMKIGIKNNVRKLTYVDTILRRWKSNGCYGVEKKNGRKKIDTEGKTFSQIFAEAEAAYGNQAGN